MSEKDEQASKPLFTLTDKEELAVIAERISAHIGKTANEKAKVRLDVAAGLIRTAISWL